METFTEWMMGASILESKTRAGMELLKLCHQADWTDDEGFRGTFVGWEAGSKENRIIIRHPLVGEVSIVVSRKTAILPRQLLATVQTKYRNRIRQIREIQAMRKAV